ncbi:MAG: hypothetical protein KKD77_24140, partial [Gammaproteobacteria bacterium]|nr:hypothetical protein [Gammaproteobacteria bacterium]
MKTIICKKGDNVIMPDGRPLHAWENEMAITRNKEISLMEKEARLKAFMAIERIFSLRRDEIPESGDIQITLRRFDAEANRDSNFHPEKYVEIKRIGKRPKMSISHRLAIDYLFRHWRRKRLEAGAGKIHMSYSIANFLAYAAGKGWVNQAKIIRDLNAKRIEKILKF